MRKIIQFFKHYWVFIVLATVASGLLFIRLNQKGQLVPKAQPTPTPQPSLSLPKITGTVIPPNTKINLQEFSFPTRLKIYQGQERPLTPDKAKKIAQELGFSGSVQESEDVFLGTFYNWSSRTNFLSIAFKANKIDYGMILGLTPTPKQGTLPSPEIAKTELENLLSKLGFSPSFELKWQKEQYLTEGYNLPPAPGQEGADFIEIGANPAVGQHQLVGSDPTNPLISLLLNKNKEIVRFQYQAYFSDFEGQEAYELKTKEEVESALLSEGRIVYFSTFQKGVLPPEITQAEFNQIALAYYQDPDKNPLLQPIYILSGRGVTKEGEETEIVAYLPAIK